jgi:hypothetical protein
MVQSLTSNSSVRLTLKRMTRFVPSTNDRKLPAASRLCSETAINSPAKLGCRDAFKALVVCEGLEVGRHADRLPTSKQTVPTIIKSNNLFDPLDAHVENAVALGEGLDVVPATCGERSAVLPQNGRHFRVGDIGRSAVAINNSAAEP